MKSLTSLLPLLLSLTTTTTATTLAQEIDPQTAWRTFAAENGHDWTVHWNRATGTPSAIYGPGLKLDREVANLAAARRESTALLDRYANLLGRGASTFVENIGVKANQVYIFVYDQEYKGLPVISGRADVRIHQIGTVAMFGAAAIRIPNGFHVNPTIAAATAKRTAEQHTLGTTSAGSGPAGARSGPRLVVWGDADSQRPTTATLAWEVQIDERPQQLVVGKVYVDASFGRVLQFKNEVFTCSCGSKHAAVGSSRHTDRRHRAAMLAELAHRPVAAPAASAASAAKAPRIALTGKVMAWTNLGILPTSPLTNTPLARLQVTSSAGSTFTDANGNFSIPYGGTSPVTVSASLQGRHSLRIRTASGTPMTASASITPGTAGTIQFGNSGMGELNRSQTATYWHVDDANVWLRSLLPSATGPMNTISRINPRVNISSNCNAYYTNNTINFYTAGGGCNMTAFQTVIVHEWGHGLDAVFGGISQIDGLSEGWADLLAIYRSRQPELGPGFRTSSNSGIRTGLNNRTYPAGGAVHVQGQTWMGWAWDVRRNLMASLGNSAGEARAHQIVVASIAADATNQPNAVREVFILDDDDGNLNNGTPNYLDLEKAALKRRLPYPKRQNPNAPTFKVFGAGCRGTGQGPSSCLVENPSGGTLTNTVRPNEYAYRVNNGQARSVTGFELFTRSQSGTITVRTAIYRSSGSAPSATPIATGTMTIGPTARFYRTNITATLPRGFFFISIDHTGGVLSNLTSGTTGNGAYWRRPPMGSGAFRQSGLITRPSFKVLCAGGGANAIPLMGNTGLPNIGASYDITLRHGKASSSATLLTGLSNTTWAGGTLPWPLALIGGTGCDLLVDPRYPIGINLDSQGDGKLTIGIPNVVSYIGVRVYHQWYVIDQATNSLGVAVSAGAESKVGKQ